MTLRNDTIQAGLIERLKSIAAITSLVTSDEIREDQWSGTEFQYPNIRVDLLNSLPSIEGCDYAEIDFFVRTYSEDASSLECDRIAGTVFQSVPRSFTSNGILFTGVRVVNLGGARRLSLREWQSNVHYRGIACG